jgi:hypothetical protein
LGSVQSGLLYWCSFVEGGTSYAAFSQGDLDLPRAHIQQFATPAIFSAPCHLTFTSYGPIIVQQSDNFPYNYTNGTRYPDSNNWMKYPGSEYLISPSSCMVRTYSTEGYTE